MFAYDSERACNLQFQLSYSETLALLQRTWLHVQPLSPVYTIQPVVKPVVKPLWQPIVSCIQTFNRGFDNRCDNRLNEQLFVQRGCQTGCQTGNRFGNRLGVCLHDTAGCQTCCTTGLIQKAHAICNFNCLIKTEWFLKVAHAVRYAVKVVMSSKRCKIETMLQQTTNRKWYMACQIAAIPMTLSDLQGHSLIAGLFRCNFYSTPQCSHCKRCTSYINSVRPSVCL